MDTEAFKPILAGLVRHALTSLGGMLVAGGYMQSSDTAAFIGGGMVVAGMAWSWWQKEGQAEVAALLKKLTAAKSVPAAVETAKDMAKTITPTVVKILLAAFALSAFLAVPSANAQGQPRLTGNIVRDIAAATPTRTERTLTGNPLGDIIGALDVKLLPDLQYALKLATASGSKVTGPCYQAWIDIINVRQKAVSDDQGAALPMPDPHLVTDFEKLVELRNSLQPDSEFMIKCSPVASMVKKDIVGFIGIVISGGAGLATMVPGL